jgi:hypothetical protein
MLTREQLVQYPGTYIFYRRLNASKARVWDAMTPEEQHHYRTTTKDEGNKRSVIPLFSSIQHGSINAEVLTRLDFRYAT